MGCFSWLFADTDNTQNLRTDRAGYIACPDGTFIHEPCYEGYGEFNGQDVYELVVRWNRAFIAENPDFLLPHIHRFYNGSVKQYRLKDFRWYPVIADLSIPFEQLRDALDKHLNVTEIRIVVESGGIESIRDREELEAGAAMSAATVKTIRVTEAIGAEVTYDLVGELVQATGLTRRTIVEMLKGINPATFHQFKLNPEEFIIKAGRIINDCKAISLIQHIQYEKRTGTFGTDIFEEATLRGTLGRDAIESTKSLYDLVVVDSEGIEKSFAESLEAEDDVVVCS